MAAPGIISQEGSEYNQTSFIGGMNLLLDDTRLQSNQYRVGFNLRNRYDTLDEIQNSVLDTNLTANAMLAGANPIIIQEVVTFGNYVIAFVSGMCFYRLYSDSGWIRIMSFSMNASAPRYWTIPVPLATTLYGRISSPANNTGTTGTAYTGGDSLGQVFQTQSVAGAFAGNLPGLLVQDNISQPQFIYVDPVLGTPTTRTTQTYTQWSATYDLTTGNLTNDQREYVPIGNTMTYANGILYIAAQDGNNIYRSVSGRPLDFVVNVNTDGSKGGDATTTSYSVGVGPVTCLRAMSTGGIFVSAQNANFNVSLNQTPNAPTLWGEYTFIRTYLFEGTCLSDRVIFDSLGDTRFVDLTGVRSFNAIQQLQNEGRNSQFTSTISRAFNGIIQDPLNTAAVLFNNFELYAVNTVFGAVIAVYDTIGQCWTAFDTTQTGGKRVKAFAKIELGIQALYAITEDNKLYQLYSSTTFATASVLTVAISANLLYANTDIKMNNAKLEIKPQNFRCIVNRITQNTLVTLTPFIDNQQSSLVPPLTKTVTFDPLVTVYTGTPTLLDVNTQLTNLLFTMPNCEQGWKCAFLLTWNSGASITQFSVELRDERPIVPLRTQSTTV